MNRCTLTILLACLLAVPVAQAQGEEDHTAHHPDADQSQAAPGQDDKAAATKMGEMQDRMKKMQELMSKIHSTSDPKERDKLMREHMESMREGMKSMRAMMDKGGMMGKKKDASSGSPAGGDQGGEMMMGGMMKMHKSMQGRMDAMQKMMEQVIEHEAVEHEMRGE